MASGRTRLLRKALLLAGVLGLATGTFVVLDALGLRGDERFLGYLLLTTLIAGGMIFYATFVVVGHQRKRLADRDRRGGDDGDVGLEE